MSRVALEKPEPIEYADLLNIKFELFEAKLYNIIATNDLRILEKMRRENNDSSQP